MSGWKDWQIGEVVTEGEFQSFIQDQVVQVYANASARDSALGANEATGMVAYLTETDEYQVYNSVGEWVAVGAGTISSVIAGTALTGGGTEGDVTLNVDLSAVTIPTSQISDITATAAALNTIDDGTEGGAAYSIGSGGVAFSAPGTAGQVLTSTGTAVEFADVASGGGGLNHIINGAFDIWQRGTSFAAANIFIADRFSINYAGGFPTETVSQQSFTEGELEVAGLGGAPFYIRKSMAAVGNCTRSSLRHRVEDVRTLAGQTVTLSFYAQADSSRTLANFFFIQVFGTGGSAQVATGLGGSSINLTTSWQRFTKTFTLGSMSGKTIGTNSNLEIRFDQDLAEGSVLDIWGVQLEAGSVATPFKRHAPSLQGELAACQRYYQRISADGASNSVASLAGVGVGITSTIADFPTQLRVQMRSNPTLLFSPTASEFRAFDGVTATTVTGLSPRANSINDQGDISIRCIVSSGLTAFRNYRLIPNTSGTPFVEFVAEL